MFLGANTEESSKRDYGIADRPADLVDHEPLDAAQVVALWVVYVCSFNAVTFDQGLKGLTSPVSHSRSRSSSSSLVHRSVLLPSCLSPWVNAQSARWLRWNI